MTETYVDTDIALTLLIDNHYDGDKVETQEDVTVPAPPVDSDGKLDRDHEDYDDWEYDNIFCWTGTGRESGNSCYVVTIASSSNLTALPIGTEFELGF